MTEKIKKYRDRARKMEELLNPIKNISVYYADGYYEFRNKFVINNYSLIYCFAICIELII